jgi:hypothetical protein
MWAKVADLMQCAWRFGEVVMGDSTKWVVQPLWKNGVGCVFGPKSGR